MNTLQEQGFTGPFEIENEAALSKGTGNMGAIMQGYKATVLNLAPMLWELTDAGYQYNTREFRVLKQTVTKDIPVVTMEELS